MREAFTLRVVEGIDAPETCRVLEITSTNLWTMLYRARERLRRCLEGKWRNGEDT
jgi:RNA polymerase sigma-70 factor (ECF subfamily)